MDSLVEVQHKAFEEIYQIDLERFSFHTTSDKLIRYLRDRRLQFGLQYLQSHVADSDLKKWSVLVICGGVGGEGMFFCQQGFFDVTSSDFSENSLDIAHQIDNTGGRLKTMLLNAEAADLPNESFDLIVVQDGLHHLPRPALGLTEMLRLARKAVLVIEPHDSLVGNMIGTEWEVHGEAVNYVFRWNKLMVNQIVKSFLLKNHGPIKVFRLWDHNMVVARLVKPLPKVLQLPAAKFVYGLLTPFNRFGNMMVSLVLK